MKHRFIIKNGIVVFVVVTVAFGGFLFLHHKANASPTGGACTTDQDCKNGNGEAVTTSSISGWGNPTFSGACVNNKEQETQCWETCQITVVGFAYCDQGVCAAGEGSGDLSSENCTVDTNDCQTQTIDCGGSQQGPSPQQSSNTPNFSASLTPPVGYTIAGVSSTFTLALTPNTSYSAETNISIQSDNAQMWCPATNSYASSCEVSLNGNGLASPPAANYTIVSDSSLAVGTYTVTVLAEQAGGASNPVSQTAQATLIVAPIPSSPPPACTVVNYSGATSGFSSSTDTGPTTDNLTVAEGSSFYTYVDYGQQMETPPASIQSPEPIGDSLDQCTFDSWIAAGDSSPGFELFAVGTAQASGKNFVYNFTSQSNESPIGPFPANNEDSYEVALDGAGNTYAAVQASLPSNYSGVLELEYGSNGNFIKQFSIPGELISPTAIAISGVSGDVYVGDSHNENIEIYGPSGGSPSSQFGSQGSNCQQGQFVSNIGGIAIDAFGNVYVTNSQGPNIEKFNSSGGNPQCFSGYGETPGQVINPEGIAIGPSGNIYVDSEGCQSSGESCIEEFTSNGSYIAHSEFLLSNVSGVPEGIAVDENGNVYVASPSDEGVQEYSSTGHFVATFPLPSGVEAYGVAIGGLIPSSGTVGKFSCTATSTPGTYTYITGTNNNPPPGSNVCASGPQTIGTVTVTQTAGSNEHYECVDNACALVANIAGLPNSNRCDPANGDADCGGGPPGTGSVHAVCDIAQQACVNEAGLGPSTCDSDPACGGPGGSGGWHLQCENDACVIAGGPLQAGETSCNAVGDSECATSAGVPSCSEFIGNPPTVTPGEPSNLMWECTNVTQCEITGSNSFTTGWTIPVPDGSIPVTPSQSTVYTLNCLNNNLPAPSNGYTDTTVVNVQGTGIKETSPPPQ